MEDVIPALIVVVLFAELRHLRSELNMMMDFIGAASEDFEAEKRLLVNLSVPLPALRSPTTTFSATGKSTFDVYVYFRIMLFLVMLF
jgi:hypothetical protein